MPDTYHRPMGRSRILPHTADVGIEVVARDLPDLLATAVAAMLALMYHGPGSGPGTRRVFVTADRDPAEGLVAVLGDVLATGEVDALGFRRIRPLPAGEALGVVAAGVPLDQVVPEGPPIKAVTYHGLRCEAHEGGWLARVLFDV